MKKQYGLALGWWAARWLAHIWVYKFLEENNIKVSEVSWTSMWAIIAAMIAIWKSNIDMIFFAKEINYLKLWDLDLKSWLLKWNKVEKKLSEIFWNMDIKDTKIPLKIVATNIETSETMIFTKWRIVDALRASISLPWIFIPKEIDGYLYVDGWIMMNLPIEVLSSKNIIASSALKINEWKIIKQKSFLWITFKTGFWKNNFEILKRSVISMMKVNEEISLNIKAKNIDLIRPDFWDLDIIDFNKVPEFVELGYKETKNVLLDK